MIEIKQDEVNTYISKYNNKETVRKYQRNFKQFIGVYNDEQALIDKINDVMTKEGAVWFIRIMMAYLRDHMNVEHDVFKKVVGVNLKQKKVVSKELSERDELIEKLEKIEDTNDKLVLQLFLEEDVLRSDVFLMKYRNITDKDTHIYKDGKFEISKLLKVNKQITVDYLKTETIELIEENIKNNNNGDYIIKMPWKTYNGRLKNGSEFLSNLSNKYFGKKIGINEYRKIDINNHEEIIKHLAHDEKTELRIQKAIRNAHTYQTQQTNYRQTKPSNLEDDVKYILNKHNMNMDELTEFIAKL